MARNRSIYNIHGVFVGPFPSTGYHLAIEGTGGATLLSGLNRIQNVSFDYGISRTDVNQLGELAAIDRVILDSPTVNVSLDYLVQSVYNEKLMGFSISSGTLTSAVSGFLNKTNDDRNIFVTTFQEGQDAINNATRTSNVFTQGFGNCFVTSYTVQGSVGNFPTASVAFEGLNAKVDAPTGSLPAVFPTDGTATTLKYNLPNYTSNPTGANWLTISALRPGDITVSLGAFGNSTHGELGALVSDLKIQSYNISANLSRTPLLKLGNKYAFSREINFPATVTASFTADLGDLKSGNLVDLVSTDGSYNLAVTIVQPTNSTPAVRYQVLGAKMDSQEYTYGIGGNDSMTINFSSQIGSASDQTNGLFISGIN